MIKVYEIRQENEFTEVVFEAGGEQGVVFFEEENLLDTQFSRTLSIQDQDELFKKIRLHRLTHNQNTGINVFYNQMKKIKLLKHRVPLYLGKMEHEIYGYCYTILIRQPDVGKKYQHLGGPDGFFGVHQTDLDVPGIQTISYYHLKQMITDNGEDFENLLAARGYNVFSVKRKAKKFPFI